MPEIIPATCVSCQDSSLSTTASIVGILTFVYALLAGLWFYLTSGAKAVATTPDQFFEVLDSILERAREIFEMQIEKTGSEAEQEELQLKTNRFRRQAVDTFLQLVRRIGSDLPLGRYNALLERARNRPHHGTEASETKDAVEFINMINLFRGMRRRHRLMVTLGGTYYVLLSPTWIRWAFRFRWNQRPLRQALNEYQKLAQEIEKIQELQAARSQRDALRQICEKLERLERRQEELSTALGVRRTESTELQDGDPLASLMRPRPSQASRSTLSLARDTPLPDIGSLP